MKRILPAIAIMLLFITCKKDDSKSKTANPPKSEFIGSWAIYSSSVSDASYPNATADMYPCMLNNLIEFKSDLTFTSSYVGNDTCWVTPPPVTPAPLRVGTIIGMKDQPVQSGTWHQDGIKVYFGASHGHGILSKGDGQTLLVEIDTLNYPSGASVIYTTVRIKK